MNWSEALDWLKHLSRDLVEDAITTVANPQAIADRLDLQPRVGDHVPSISNGKPAQMGSVENSPLPLGKGAFDKYAVQGRDVTDVWQADHKTAARLEARLCVPQLFSRVNEMFQHIGKNDAIEANTWKQRLPLHAIYISMDNVVKMKRCLGGKD